jgi:hypothetical protein
VKTYPSLLVVIVIAAGSLGFACAEAKVAQSEASGGSEGGGNHGGSGGSTSVYFDMDASVTRPDTRKVDLPPDVQPFGYDDAGTPICLSILSLGQPAVYGAGSGSTDNTNAFQDYMNTYTKNANTGTTSVMTMVKSRATITADFLKSYNVLILQALEDDIHAGSIWTFSQSETDALAKWVQEGGALITMTGYGGVSNEVQPLNQLLGGSNKWSGISYNTDDIFANCLDNMCYCTDSSLGFDGWQTNYADYDQLTHNLKKVGVFHGRSINCTGSDCQVFAKDSSGNKIGVAKVVGKGHVVAWADEWVTYTSQWGIQASQWDSHTECTAVNRTAKLSYGVPQFWYDVFSWSSPDMQWCFTITVPPDADPGQAVIP